MGHNLAKQTWFNARRIYEESLKAHNVIEDTRRKLLVRVFDSQEMRIILASDDMAFASLIADTMAEHSVFINAMDKPVPEKDYFSLVGMSMMILSLKTMKEPQFGGGDLVHLEL